MKKFTKISIVLFTLIVGFNNVQATTYYVATTGNNGNSNAQAQSTATPWKTINFAVSKLAAGDILYVRGGTYVESVWIGNSGTVSAPITIAAYSGESPVIDGQNTYPTSSWASLMELNGNYIVVSGFEVKNTSTNNARGITLVGHHNTVSKCNVHHTNQNGILIQGDYGIVEDSQVWQSCQNNSANPGAQNWASGLSAARDPANGITDNAIIRRNTVYNNWGEGLSTYEANGTIIEDNIVYDNWAQLVYISDASYVTFRRNMVYNTPGNAVGKQASTSLADEVAGKPRSTNNTIINNFFLNTTFSAFSWTIVSGSGLTNVLIANNTFVNSNFNTGNINSGNKISNNIFTTSGTVPSATGITWNNNLWQGTRPANAVGTGDVLGDPLLAKTGTIGPGLLTAGYFKLSSASSPAINKAAVLSQVTEDYFRAARGTSPDIGGHEYAAAVTPPPPSFCSSAQAPVIDGTAESTWTSIKSDTLKNIIAGTITSNSDLFTTYSAIWDNTALYLLVKVKDDVLKNDSGINTWDDDALEIFIDGNNDKAATYDANDHQYILRINDPVVYEYHNGVSSQNPVGVSFSQGANTGGYLMEIKITWAAIGVTPASGKLVGLDIFTDDDDDGAAADGSLSWFTQGTASSYDPSTFGTISLSATMCNGTTTGIINREIDNVSVIYPNPFSENTTIDFANIKKSTGDNLGFYLYNMIGKEVAAFTNISTDKILLEKNNLAEGMYFYRVVLNEKAIDTGKLIVQ